MSDQAIYAAALAASFDTLDKFEEQLAADDRLPVMLIAGAGVFTKPHVIRPLNAPSKTGGSYAALTTSRKSSQAPHSKTELKPNPTKSPHDQQSSNTRFDNNSRFPPLLLFAALASVFKRPLASKGPRSAWSAL
ncbi:hypothetical protein [Yoonia sp. MH D7]